MPIAIKICGFADEAALEAAMGAGVDYIGFVHFPPSARHVTPERAARLKALLPPAMRSVSVLVDPDDNLLAQVQQALAPDWVQLHGKETPGRLADIRGRYPSFKLIKALRVRTSDDVAQAMAFAGCADALLFDAKPPELPGMLPGGNGLAFDWALLKGRDFPLPWFLSGGLNAENVAEAIRQSGARMVDISSGVECAPGVKDAALIQEFVRVARAVDSE